MIKTKDLYIHEENYALTSSGIVEGLVEVEYEVSRYIDLKNLIAKPSYLVKCTYRMLIPGIPFNPAPSTPAVGFADYPALVNNVIQLTPKSPNISGTDYTLVDYAPRTLNTAVMTDVSSSSSKSTEASRQHTTGSSTSQTNSYGGSISVGAMGDVPSGSLSGNYEHAGTRGHERSSSATHSESHEAGDSDSASISIKDWGSYAQVDNPAAQGASKTTQAASWVWGQEFPWNIIQFRSPSAKGGNNIQLPAFVQGRLWDSTDKQAYPPSELSLFGLDFISKAVWLVTPSKEIATDDEIEVTHSGTLTKASHSGPASESDPVAATLDTVTLSTVTSKVLNLGVLALDPIRHLEPNNGAVIGFVPDKFAVAPTSTSGDFKIGSEANNLLILGNGFTGPMFTDFSDGPVTMTVYFKIIDTDRDYELFLKHWKMEDQAVIMTITVNSEANAITRHVDALEGDGGDQNMTSVFLRNKDYTSIDYCDYLNLGLNTIKITFAPSKDSPASTSACGYEIRAFAIG